MIDALKKTLYAGLGATVVTAEKIESSLQELVEKGKLSADDARETARKISEDSKKEFEEAQSSLKSMFEELLERAPVAWKRDLDAVNERLDALEKKAEPGPDSES
jgi:polyhydroxyalkanoate synthesis regulator phasin